MITRHKRLLRILSFIAILTAYPIVNAEPNLMGQTGLVAMPDAYVEPVGTWRLGTSASDPYVPLYTSLTPVPRVELSGRFMRIKDVLGIPGTAYGDYKDREFDIKLQLLTEGKFWPAIALGAQDIFGTRIFGADYVAASKRIGPLDVTLGYGRNRIDGVFGGIRYYPTEKKNFALVAEYDANNYAKDFSGAISGADKRRNGATFGLEYTWGWLGAQLSRQQGQYGAAAHVSIPLETPDFIPKLNEPEPYTTVTTRPTYEQWQADKIHKNRMARALNDDDFTNIGIRSTGPDLYLKLSNSRISELPRAVGRAARVAALLSPIETRRVFVTYTLIEMPAVTYEFGDANQLQKYFNGQITRKELANSVTISYPPGGAVNQGYSDSDLYLGLDDDQPGLKTVFNDDGDLISLKRTDTLLNRIKIAPKLTLLLNDPSGAVHYNIFASADYVRNLGHQLFLEGTADLTLVEDISKAAATPNSSLLPHVRSDIPLYKRDSKFKLSTLLLNKYFHPSERVFARGSAGLYEEMFGGVGGQALYMPASGNLATDLAVDWVKQRDTKGLFGFRPYSTVTAIISTRYRLPHGVTATVRAGRFLAKDSGARFELKRRFESGFEMGAWYTRTNGNDLTASGNAGKPYYDKGVFLAIPLGRLLTKDSQAIAGFSIAPWTRDVGQMVASPGDLYGIVEKSLVHDVHNRDGLVRFGDVEDNY
ncbi:MAG: YjbH domain-containing protein [Burkholderiales bacterium]